MRGRSVINRDILVLRETVGKLTQLLAGQGLVVTQRGTQAYVRTDVKTLKSIRVNIPHIADNASDSYQLIREPLVLRIRFPVAAQHKLGVLGIQAQVVDFFHSRKRFPSMLDIRCGRASANCAAS